MGKFEKGQWVRVLHTDYQEEFPVGSVFKVGASYVHGIEPEGEHKELFFFHEEVELWQPKVGDRVTVVDNITPSGEPIAKYPVGSELVVDRICKDGDGKEAYLFLGHYQYLRQDQVATVVAQAQPAALKIEAGKFYKTRDGRKVGPMSRHNEGWAVGGRGNMWIDTGERYFRDDRGGDSDLVALWEEPANDNAAPAKPSDDKPKFKVGDRVRCLFAWIGVEEGEIHTVKAVDEDDEGVQLLLDERGEPYCWMGYDEIELVSSTPAIVALIENGTAKPATKPKVHADQASATTEAERLALQFPGQQFGVFVLADSKIADLVNVPTPVLRAA